MKRYEWNGKEVYSFEEWCADCEVAPFGSHPDVYVVLWSAHEMAYKEYCASINCDFENLLF